MEQPITSLSLHLRGQVVTKGKSIINLVKSQPLFDVHRQYLWMFLIDLQAEVSRFHCRIFITVLLIFSKFSSVRIGFYLL